MSDKEVFEMLIQIQLKLDTLADEATYEQLHKFLTSPKYTFDQDLKDILLGFD
jgi:hypothetical protein